ncbi:MAG: sulfur oxidation c-type cytochrome SoxX [Pseudomonadota bacterium]
MIGCVAEETQSFTVVGDAIPVALIKTVGDAERGQAIFLDRERGHCVLCHAVDGLNARFQGNVGPALNGIGARLNEGQLRLRVVDYTQIDPNVIMPSYFRSDNLHQVGQAYEGQTVLSAQEVENIVAYLMTLDGAPS